MSVRHFIVVAIGAVCSVSAAGAQEMSSADQIPNWTAPPYWAPGLVSAVERQKSQEGVFSPEVIQALPSAPLPFVAIAPCRLLDTRNNLNPLGGGGPFAADEIRTYTLPGACTLPSGIQAVSLNVTATNTGAEAFGHVKVWPADGTEPNVSTLNYPGAGATVANAAIVPLSSTGAMNAKSGNASADLILDVNGYYAPISIVNTVNGLAGAVTLAAGSNITITPAGQALTIASTGSGVGWSLTGNGGTAPGMNFVGTTDNQALELRVNGARALRLEPGSTPNVIGGLNSNSVTPGVRGATIGGGGFAPNQVTDDFGTVGGGSENMAGDGAGTTSDRESATVCGGIGNKARGARSTVGGGTTNDASGGLSTIGGGAANIASGFYSTVPGSYNNTAAGDYTFAAGRQAKANHNGAFVWGDSTAADIASTAANQFLIRANGGAVFIRGTAAVPTVSATITAQNGGSGEAAWLYTSSPSVPWPVVKLLKNPSSTNNYLECESAGVATKCHITSAGSFVAGSDFAEALPARGGSQTVEPGDVLVASRELPGGVEKSGRRYDARAVGVFSTRPGFIGADKDGDTRIDADDIPVAITGIVPTKVTSENGPIEPGDLLTTSSTPGFAMKAKPVRVAGIEIYPPGTLIGKALEPLKVGKGKIKMLVLLR